MRAKPVARGRECARLGQYLAAGVSKFVLRPVGAGGDDLMGQTRRLIAEVLPELGGPVAE